MAAPNGAAPADHELAFGSWDALEISGSLPCPRNSVGCALVGSRVYICGGTRATMEDDRTLYHSDMYMLDLEGKPLQWQLVEQLGDLPSARECPTLTAVGDDLYLYGGADKEDTYVCATGLYVFSIATRTWEHRETTGPAPRAQSITAVCWEGSLVLFGGVLDGQAQNVTYILDIGSLEWRVAKTTGKVPPIRCDHGCCLVGSRMYVSGGSGGENVWYNDLYYLDLQTLEWTKLMMEGNPPQPRDYLTLNSLSNLYLVVFGGFNEFDGKEKCFSDLHYVDITAPSGSFSWRSVTPPGSGKPAERYGHSAVIYNKALYVLVGQNSDHDFNDVWRVEMKAPMSRYEPTPVPRTRYTTATPIPAPRKTITPSQPTPVKPRDFDELRNGYIKRINEMFDTLAERFQQLDSATATLETERTAFEAEKKAHYELYEKQQHELKEMLDNHRTQNEEWIGKVRSENDSERRSLAEERAAMERASAELARQQDVFQQKSKKLDAIMKQVQGLNA